MIFDRIVICKELSDFSFTPTRFERNQRNKCSWLYGYHVRDWLTDINNVSSTTEPFSAKYDYFDDGNIQRATFYNQTSPIEQKFKYEFTYDPRKQLLSADYFKDASGSWQTVSNFDVTGLAYDANGNILTLNRRKETGSSIDNLTYNYGSNNQRSATVCAGHK